ncbi:LuxR C-terminal-related transcriptional regulator [Streptomyces sp. NBC_00328]|uniref:LuxR C-terminal-related transcriptional regulator n=1 Tax=Streptomyces sp. NBC_00328 TaxID=2903646 RepID=UPI002E2C9D20|nr:LuxR C-terminal-related transcriptional regulator [Streptomyces sp. NBC_00328]
MARQVSISTPTVEYHLRNIFTQLGVRSRSALAPHLDLDRVDGPHERAVCQAHDV